MKVCKAKIHPVQVRPGVGTLKDAVNEALRDWITNIKTTYYSIGSVVGPHPYPLLVRDFQKIIGEEIKKQILQKWEMGKIWQGCMTVPGPITHLPILVNSGLWILTDW